MNYKCLFEPYQLGPLYLKNRVVMGPASTRTGDVETNRPSQRTVDYFTARAKGGVGTIVVEHTCVTQRGIFGLGALCAYQDDVVPAWKKLVDGVHQYGCVTFAQLQDGGAAAHPLVNGGLQTVAASSVPDHFKRHFPDEISLEDIEEYKKAYIKSAGHMLEAGFDGIQLHLANGYFLASFLSTRANKRTDCYGGSLENRLRLPLELISELRRAYGNFPLIARLGLSEARLGRNLNETRAIALALQDAGVMAISFNSGSYFEKNYELPPYHQDPGFFMDQLATVKKDLSIPVMGGARITEPLLADMFLRSGSVDLIEINRGHIADPEWCNKAQSGNTDSIRKCIACVRCGVRPNSDYGVLNIRTQPTEGEQKEVNTVTCSVNPYTGAERALATQPAKEKKKVLVIGGGPAGLQAAYVAAEKKGHDVILVEKQRSLGGLARAAAMPPKKGEVVNLITALAYDCRKAGVDIRLNTEATPDYIREVAPDVILVATGTKSIRPTFIKGHEEAHFVQAVDLLTGKGMADMPIGKKFMVLGGGSVGFETAEFLSVYENEVDIYEMMDSIDGWCNLATEAEWQTYKHCKELGVGINLGCTCKEIKDNKVVYEKDGELKESGKYDYFISAVGEKPDTSLLDALKKEGFDPIPVGNCGFKRASRFYEVLLDAIEVANSLD